MLAVSSTVFLPSLQVTLAAWKVSPFGFVAVWDVEILTMWAIFIFVVCLVCFDNRSLAEL